MRRIQLQKCKEALVDDRFYDALLAMGRWSSKRSGASRAFKSMGGVAKHHYMHHVVLELAGIKRKRGQKVDHRNRNNLDNRLRNLRLVTSQQNSCNRGANKNSKTGLKGVNPHKGKFRAGIRHDGVQYHLGLFTTALEAAAAYNKAARRLHGQFAFQNKLRKAA